MYTLMAIWRSRHSHSGISIVIRIGISIGIAKKIFLFSEIVLKKEKIYAFSCTELWFQYHFDTNSYFLRFPIHPSTGVHWCSRKRLFEFSEASDHWCFQKITAPKIQHTSQQNIQGGILFQ